MFNYFGAKHRLAPTYQAPRHPTIIEPFAGAAGYSCYWLTQRSDLRAIIVDSNPLVVELWRLLLSMTPTDIDTYPTPIQGERSSDLLWASAASATSSWGAIANTGEFQVTEWIARDFPGQRRRMADLRWRIGDRISVISGDYSDSPDIEATWFIDPPYQDQGVWYEHNGDVIDFDRLGEWCRARPGQAIVCEAGDADWLPFDHHATAMTQVNGIQSEVVWCSHPEPTLLDLIS